MEIFGIKPMSFFEKYGDEIHLKLNNSDFQSACLALHQNLNSPVMMLFAEELKSGFCVRCVFQNNKQKKWFFVEIDVSKENPIFDSLSKEIYSANLFEREIHEMFGIEPLGSPDLRPLNLHGEIWPQELHPLRKDFSSDKNKTFLPKDYTFTNVSGSGVFEIPVGPVHAGIIGPGHFRFSVAGEPIIYMEERLGFTHKGIEKLMEGKSITEGLMLVQCVSGDSTFAHSQAFCSALEKIFGVDVTINAKYLRVLYLELERMYNHVNNIGGIALDVGFTFPSGFASMIKESILSLNEQLCGSRYLKRLNVVGGLSKGIDNNEKHLIREYLKKASADFERLVKILFSNEIFLDRVEGTGILREKTARDIGIVGLAARASGINSDLRRDFPGVYEKLGFVSRVYRNGDVFDRLNLRIAEFRESIKLIRNVLDVCDDGKERILPFEIREGSAIGYAEGWRGPVLYWVSIEESGLITRCKIVDPSFHNWQGLSYAVLGEIIPDFPLCNKSFDLSYSGNDL